MGTATIEINRLLKIVDEKESRYKKLVKEKSQDDMQLKRKYKEWQDALKHKDNLKGFIGRNPSDELTTINFINVKGEITELTYEITRANKVYSLELNIEIDYNDNFEDALDYILSQVSNQQGVDLQIQKTLILSNKSKGNVFTTIDLNLLNE